MKESEVEIQAEVERRQRAEKERWLNHYSQYLSPDARIVFKDRKFVFDGLGYDIDKDRVTEILTQKGGLVRSAVSGQTDYLICDPQHAGDAKIRALLEQRKKGKCQNTKVVPADVFYRQLGIDPEAESTAAASAEKREPQSLQQLLEGLTE